MEEIEKTCENCQYECEDMEGTHCRHCIHSAEEHFKPKEIHATEQEIRNKAIDEFAEWIEFFVDGYYFKSKEEMIEEFEKQIAEQMKGK